MLTQILQQLYRRDLEKLKQEIAAYKSDNAIWRTDKDIPNSGGNLALHLCGNLSHFIGATLGNTGYVRNRNLEFSDKGVPREDLIKKIDETIEAVDKTLGSLSDDQMEKDFPIEVFKDRSVTSTEWMLVHLATHLNYHLGQINYHRRLLDN
jgi:uncharacterized damage-inducible protein DinB